MDTGNGVAALAKAAGVIGKTPTDSKSQLLSLPLTAGSGAHERNGIGGSSDHCNFMFDFSHIPSAVAAALGAAAASSNAAAAAAAADSETMRLMRQLFQARA